MLIVVNVILASILVDISRREPELEEKPPICVKSETRYL